MNADMNRETMTDRVMTRCAVAILALVFLTLPAIVPARAAVDIQEVTSESGVTAWLVEDYTVPIVSVRFAFKGGSTQDPQGREGIANLMTGLFDEGAGELDAATFQERLDDVGAEIGFNAARDAIYGQMRTLAEEREDAFELLRLALNEPRFDEEPVNRIRAQILTGIQQEMRDPQALGQQEFSRALYGDHPYARRSSGTPESLAAISGEYLHDQHRRLFARSNLYVAVVGAIDAETLKAELDRVFGSLPEQAELDEVPYAAPKLDQEVLYPYALPQSTIQLVYPGIDRDDPEFFPAFLMNHILGGGDFSSRLFLEVREKRGLAYGVGSGLMNSDYSDSLFIGTSTRADRTQEALTVIKDAVNEIVENGVTDAELAAAKTYLIGAYPINNLDSSASVARTLVQLQMDDRGMDYIDRRVGYIEAVTREQVQAAAKRLLESEPAILVIGPEAEAGDESNGG